MRFSHELKKAGPDMVRETTHTFSRASLERADRAAKTAAEHILVTRLSMEKKCITRDFSQRMPRECWAVRQLVYKTFCSRFLLTTQHSRYREGAAVCPLERMCLENIAQPDHGCTIATARWCSGLWVGHSLLNDENLLMIVSELVGCRTARRTGGRQKGPTPNSWNGVPMASHGTTKLESEGADRPKLL